MKQFQILQVTGVLMLSWPACALAHEEPIHQEEGITVGAEAHQEHEPEHGGVFGMVGDYHLELVEREGEFRVYLYDAFTKSMSTARLAGELVYYATERTGEQTYEASETRLPLKPDPANVYLMAAKVPGPQPDEVTVMLQLQGQDLEMTFPLRVTLEGRVVDLACFAKEGMAALERAHDECARQCLLAGSPVGILVGDAPNAPVYLVTLRGEGTSSRAANERLLRFVSRKVSVTGRLNQRGQLTMVELQDVTPLD